MLFRCLDSFIKLVLSDFMLSHQFCILDLDECDKDPRDVSVNVSFNRFDPKYVSIGPKTPQLSLTNSKCATLKHTGRFGGSLSPNPPKNVIQPTVQQNQHVQLQQHHLQTSGNQQHHQQLQLEVQTYQLQNQNQSFNVATVSRDYQHHFPSSNSASSQKSGFVETSSILKKHREEVQEIAKPQPVFSFDPSKHRQLQQQLQQHQMQDMSRSSKSISIINQPLPDIPKQHSNMLNPQVLSASTLESYRSLQRPQKHQQQNYPSSTIQRGRDREQRPALPVKTMPPVLPPKNRQQIQQQRYQDATSMYPSRSYERERERSRDRLSRTHEENPRTPSRYQQQQMQQQSFQTLPHHHHHPSSYPSQPLSHSSSSKSNRKSDSKSLSRSREMMQPRFDNYSATEL